MNRSTVAAVFLVVAAAAVGLIVALWPNRDTSHDGEPRPGVAFDSFDSESGMSADIPSAPAPPDSEARGDRAAPQPDTTGGDATAPEQIPEPVPDELRRHHVRKAVRAFIPLAQRCYTEMLRDEPDRVVRAKMTLEIVAEGKAGHVELVQIGGGDRLDADFHECLLDDIEDVEFDAPPGRHRRRITYPFVFRPDQKGDAGP